MSFATLLIANRGEIARRVIRSAHAMGIRCVAVYVDADADAPHVGDADEAVRLPGSYLDAKAILEAARSAGAGAVHPGYGFLSESAAFAADVTAAGLVWVGPAPDAIERMGDKLAAKALAQEAGVPTLPGSDDPTADGRIGYPLLVKAAAGGGGRGVRIVESPDGLEEAVAERDKGIRLRMAVEIGYAPETQTNAAAGLAGDGDVDGLAWNVVLSVMDFKPNHSIGLNYGQVDAGWLLSPQFRQNEWLAEIRYQWRKSRKLAFDFRIRKRKELEQPILSDQKHEELDYFIRFTWGGTIR